MENILFALIDGDVEKIKEGLNKGLDIDMIVMQGNSLLASAAYYGHAQIVELLVEKGADLTIRNDAGQTALTAARVAKHQQIYDYLKLKGATE